MCDVARRGCNAACDSNRRRMRHRAGNLRCRTRCCRAMLRYRATWRNHPRGILTGPRRPCDIAPALGDIATSPRARERCSDIAQALRDVARDVARGAWPSDSSRIFDDPPRPCGRPRLWCDVAMSCRQSAMSLGRLGFEGDVATSHRPCAMALALSQVRCCDVVRCGAPIPATFSRARNGRATSHPP